MSLTAMSAFVDGVSLIWFCRLTRADATSTISPVLCCSLTMAPLAMTIIICASLVYVPSGMVTGFGVEELARRSFPDLIENVVTAFGETGFAESGAAADVWAERAVALIVVSKATQRRTENTTTSTLIFVRK